MKSENYNRSEEMQVDFLESDSMSGNTFLRWSFKNVQERTPLLPVKYCAAEKPFAYFTTSLFINK